MRRILGTPTLRTFSLILENNIPYAMRVSNKITMVSFKFLSCNFGSYQFPRFASIAAVNVLVDGVFTQRIVPTPSDAIDPWGVSIKESILRVNCFSSYKSLFIKEIIVEGAYLTIYLVSDVNKLRETEE